MARQCAKSHMPMGWGQRPRRVPQVTMVRSLTGRLHSHTLTPGDSSNPSPTPQSGRTMSPGPEALPEPLAGEDCVCPSGGPQGVWEAERQAQEAAPFHGHAAGAGAGAAAQSPVGPTQVRTALWEPARACALPWACRAALRGPRCSQDPAHCILSLGAQAQACMRVWVEGVLAGR